jgi:hypothetical protein
MHIVGYTGELQNQYNAYFDAPGAKSTDSISSVMLSPKKMGLYSIVKRRNHYKLLWWHYIDLC